MWALFTAIVLFGPFLIAVAYRLRRKDPETVQLERLADAMKRERDLVLDESRRSGHGVGAPRCGACSLSRARRLRSMPWRPSSNSTRGWGV